MLRGIILPDGGVKRTNFSPAHGQKWDLKISKIFFERRRVTPRKVFKRSCGVSILRDIKNPGGHTPGYSALADQAEAWTR